MADSNSTTDKRKRITPEVFEVDPSLLDIPLATPKRRLIAILLDLLIIGVFSTFGFVFLCLFLGILFARAFIRAKRIPKDKREKIARHKPLLMLGVAVSCLLLAVVSSSMNQSQSPFNSNGDTKETFMNEGLAKGKLVSTWSDMEDADDDEQIEIATEVIQELTSAGVESRKIENYITKIQDEFDYPEEFADILIDSNIQYAINSEETTVEFEQGKSPSELAKEYLEKIELRAAASEIETSQEALKYSLAGEEISKLNNQNKTYRQKLKDQRSKKNNWGYSIIELLKSAAQDLGFTVGWSMFYFTTLPAFFRGKTIGKRLLGLQVIRLDGKPLSLWNTFERGGAYSAGLATGLLGFVQIYWDPNRQAIQDKIAGTAVIRIQK